MKRLALTLSLLTLSPALSADGLDAYRSRLLQEARTGQLDRPVALSSDRRYLLLGDAIPDSLLVLNAADLSPLKTLPLSRLTPSPRIAAIHDAPPRKSFFVLPQAIPEIWELTYASPPPPGFGNPWVHDFRYEADGEESLILHRYKLRSPWRDFAFSRDFVFVVGTTTEGERQLLDLDLKRPVPLSATLPEMAPIQGPAPFLAQCTRSTHNGHDSYRCPGGDIQR